MKIIEICEDYLPQLVKNLLLNEIQGGGHLPNSGRYNEFPDPRLVHVEINGEKQFYDDGQPIMAYAYVCSNCKGTGENQSRRLIGAKQGHGHNSKKSDVFGGPCNHKDRALGAHCFNGLMKKDFGGKIYYDRSEVDKMKKTPKDDSQLNPENPLRDKYPTRKDDPLNLISKEDFINGYPEEYAAYLLKKDSKHNRPHENAFYDYITSKLNSNEGIDSLYIDPFLRNVVKTEKNKKAHMKDNNLIHTQGKENIKAANNTINPQTGQKYDIPVNGRWVQSNNNRKAYKRR